MINNFFFDKNNFKYKIRILNSDGLEYIKVYFISLNEDLQIVNGLPYLLGKICDNEIIWLSKLITYDRNLSEVKEYCEKLVKNKAFL